jgi:hypothetical protein
MIGAAAKGRERQREKEKRKNTHNNRVTVPDSNYFQKNYLCNVYELLSRSMSCVQMQHRPPVNPPNTHNTYLLVCEVVAKQKLEWYKKRKKWW